MNKSVKFFFYGLAAVILFAFGIEKCHAAEITPPSFTPCFTVIKNIKVNHICVHLTVEDKKYSMMFSQDGTTIVALIRLHEDGTQEVLYLIRDPIRV